MREPLTMRRGDTSGWDMAVVKPDGSPFNLTGFVIYFTAKRQITDADPGVFQLSTTNGAIVVTNAAGGLATVKPRRTDTSGLTEDVRLLYDVQLSTAVAPDETDTVDWGDLVILRDVTRAP